MTIVFAALVLAGQTVAVSPSTFCVGEDCRSIRAVRPVVTPSDERRNFVWISSDSTQVTVGTIAAGASEVSLGQSSQAHKLAVRYSDGLQTAAKIDFELRCEALTWKWSLSHSARRPVEIRHPGADCTLLLRSDGYASVERQLGDAARVDDLYLQKLPVLSGTVTDAVTETAIAGAEVTRPDGEILATTDAKGRFRASVAGAWPDLVHLVAPGYATRTVLISKAVADTDLSVRLSSGGSLTITLDPPLGQEDVSWEVRRILARSRDELTRSGRLPAGQTKAVVDALEAGEYRVIVAGSEPLQRFGVSVNVSDGANADAVIRITPGVLRLEVRFGDRPLDAASVRLRLNEGTWTAAVTTDDDGRIVEEVWQHGTYFATVTRVPLVPFWRDKQEIEDGEQSTWVIVVADRRLRGRVVDEDAGLPIPQARILLTVKRDDGSSMIPLQSNSDGSFEFTGLPAGAYLLEVMKKGYQPLRTSWMSTPEAEIVEAGDLRLSAAGNRALLAVNAHGVPIAMAASYVWSRNGTRYAGRTDDQGRLALPIRRDEAGVVFVLPQSGSIGFARFDALTEETGDVVVRVSDGTASLEIIAETTSGDPLSDVAVLIRIDGILLPIDVRDGFTNHQGVPLVTDTRGRLLFPRLPPGRYEIWPLSPEDYRAVGSASPPPAPINLMLVPGHQSAKLVFKKRPR